MTLQQRACFLCRKCFKKSEESAKCPQCGGPLFTMGTAFRAPKQTDIEQWQKAEALVRAGVLFRKDTGPRPATAKEVTTFLESNTPRTPGEQLLRRSAAKSATPAKSQGRVKRVETEGRPRFTLAGRPLQSWSMVEVRDEGRWTVGVFRADAQPHIRTDSGKVVLVKPNTVCRWPQR